MIELDDRTQKPLCLALARIQSPDEIAIFLEDLCSVGELKALVQRMEVARCLTAGLNYVQIIQITGASSATISRVSRCLQYGPGGYQVALEKIRPKP